VRILTRADLNRQLVKSPTCTVVLPDFELTLPPGKGQLTTVEGLLRDIILDLATDQPVRKHMDPETHDKIAKLISQLREVLPDASEDPEEVENAGGTIVHHVDESEGDESLPVKPFAVRLDDPAGNSFLEFIGSTADPKWNLRTYTRSREDDIAIGLVAPDDDSTNQVATIHEESELAGDVEPGKENEEVYVFPGICSSCSAPLDTRMKKVVIPYFKVIFYLSPTHSSFIDLP
jgi:zinc finger protein